MKRGYLPIQNLRINTEPTHEWIGTPCPCCDYELIKVVVNDNQFCSNSIVLCDYELTSDKYRLMFFKETGHWPDDKILSLPAI